MYIPCIIHYITYFFVICILLWCWSLYELLVIVTSHMKAIESVRESIRLFSCPSHLECLNKWVVLKTIQRALECLVTGLWVVMWYFMFLIICDGNASVSLFEHWIAKSVLFIWILKKPKLMFSHVTLWPGNKSIFGIRCVQSGYFSKWES